MQGILQFLMKIWTKKIWTCKEKLIEFTQLNRLNKTNSDNNLLVVAPNIQLKEKHFSSQIVFWIRIILLFYFELVFFFRGFHYDIRYFMDLV